MAKTLHKRLNGAVEAIKATYIEEDAFVILWTADRGREVWGLTKDGEFEQLPRLENIAMYPAEEAIVKSVIFRDQPVTGKSVGLVLHARSYRDILLMRAEQDRQSIDEILTRYETD